MASCSSSAFRSLSPASRSIWSSDADRPPRDGAPSCVTMRRTSPPMDLFVAPTIGFDLLYVLVIIRLERRNLVWINVTPHPTAEWIARQVTEAFPWADAPRYLIRDRDRSTARPSPADYGPWASATSPLPQARLGRTASPKIDRIDPSRVCRPCCRLGRSALTPDPHEVCRLL